MVPWNVLFIIRILYLIFWIFHRVFQLSVHTRHIMDSETANRYNTSLRLVFTALVFYVSCRIGEAWSQAEDNYRSCAIQANTSSFDRQWLRAPVYDQPNTRRQPADNPKPQSAVDYFVIKYRNTR